MDLLGGEGRVMRDLTLRGCDPETYNTCQPVKPPIAGPLTTRRESPNCPSAQPGNEGWATPCPPHQDWSRGRTRGQGYGKWAVLTQTKGPDNEDEGS